MSDFEYIILNQIQNDGKAESYMKKSKQSKTKFKNFKQVIV